MNFYTLVQSAVDDTVYHSLWLFGPELVVAATIVALLLAAMLLPRLGDRRLLGHGGRTRRGTRARGALALIFSRAASTRPRNSSPACSSSTR